MTANRFAIWYVTLIGIAAICGALGIGRLGMLVVAVVWSVIYWRSSFGRE